MPESFTFLLVCYSVKFAKWKAASKLVDCLISRFNSTKRRKAGKEVNTVLVVHSHDKS